MQRLALSVRVRRQRTAQDVDAHWSGFVVVVAQRLPRGGGCAVVADQSS